MHHPPEIRTRSSATGAAAAASSPHPRTAVSSSSSPYPKSAGSSSSSGGSSSSVNHPDSVMRWCHVLYARNKAPALAAPVVKELVAAQIKAAQPVRAPWYRHAAASNSSSSGTPPSRHAVDAGNAQVEGSGQQQQQQVEDDMQPDTVRTQDQTKKDCIKAATSATGTDGTASDDSHAATAPRSSDSSQRGVNKSPASAAVSGTGVFLPPDLAQHMKLIS